MCSAIPGGLPPIATTLKVRLEHCVLHRADEPGASFLAIRAQRVKAETVECRGERHRVRMCHGCPHFLDVASRGALRCFFLDTDTVESLMTPAARIVTVDIREVRTSPRRRTPRQLLVTEGDSAVALVATNGRARSRLRPIPIVPRTTSLAAAAAILREQRALVVVDRDEVVGIVTGGDLSRAGVPSSTTI
jgi:CBS domain